MQALTRRRLDGAGAPPRGARALSELQQAVLEANLELPRRGLVRGTWGNVSGVLRERGLVVIKPSGIPYDRLRREDMVVVALESGEVVAGRHRPSSDTPTHLELYRAFSALGGIVHTHSLHATAWAQAVRDIPALGTTHADDFLGPVRCTRRLRPAEIRRDYERHTGRVIVERFRGTDPLRTPAALVASHGPFAWGRSPAEAVANADVLEFVARLAAETLRLAPSLRPMQAQLMNKHFLRKHGAGAYYGQHREKP